MTTNIPKPKQGGRKPKAAPAVYRYYIRFNEAEHNEFLTRYERSGMNVKAHFITSCIFNRELKVVKIDKAAMDYYMRLTTFHLQFRAIGTNYNQVTTEVNELCGFSSLNYFGKALKKHFGKLPSEVMERV